MGNPFNVFVFELKLFTHTHKKQREMDDKTNLTLTSKSFESSGANRKLPANEFIQIRFVVQFNRPVYSITLRLELAHLGGGGTSLEIGFV